MTRKTEASLFPNTRSLSSPSSNFLVTVIVISLYRSVENQSCHHFLSGRSQQGDRETKGKLARLLYRERDADTATHAPPHLPVLEKSTKTVPEMTCLLGDATDNVTT